MSVGPCEWRRSSRDRPCVRSLLSSPRPSESVSDSIFHSLERAIHIYALGVPQGIVSRSGYGAAALQALRCRVHVHSEVPDNEYVSPYKKKQIWLHDHGQCPRHDRRQVNSAPRTRTTANQSAQRVAARSDIVFHDRPLPFRCSVHVVALPAIWATTDVRTGSHPIQPRAQPAHTASVGGPSFLERPLCSNRRIAMMRVCATRQLSPDNRRRCQHRQCYTSDPGRSLNYPTSAAPW
jgi:hypothetical protein